MSVVFTRIESFLKLMDERYQGDCYYICHYLNTNSIKKTISYLIGYLFYVISQSVINNSLNKNFRKVLYVLQYFNFHEREQTITDFIVEQLNTVLKRVNDRIYNNRVYDEIVNTLTDTMYLIDNRELVESKNNFMEYLVFKRKDYNYIKYVISNYPNLSNIVLENDYNLLEVVIEKYIEELLKRDAKVKSTDALYYEKLIKLFVFYNSGLIRNEKIKFIIQAKTKDLPLKEQEEIAQHIINIILCKGNLYCSNFILSDGLNEKLAEFPVDQNGRYDLTSLYTVTIDTPKAFYIDDAISAMVLPNGNLLVVNSIADVISNMIGHDTSIINLIKLMEYRFVISKPIKLYSSLEPSINKNALSHFFEIDSFGNIVDFRVVKSVIRSSLKLCYDLPYERMVYCVDDNLRYNMRLYEQMLKRLSYKYEYGYDDTFAGAIIASLAVTTNSTVGEYFSKNNLPFTFRVNTKIDMGRILNMDSVCNMNFKKFTRLLAKEEAKWFNCRAAFRYSVSSKPFDYVEDYGRVTSPIIEKLSRILQALEHTYLIEGDRSDYTRHIWEDYLASWQADKPYIKRK